MGRNVSGVEILKINLAKEAPNEKDLLIDLHPLFSLPGGLFNLAVRLMHLFSESRDDFVGLTSLLGLYFQIRDDYANLCLDEYAENKSFAEDLTEGKFSFPIIHAIRYKYEQVASSVGADGGHKPPNHTIFLSGASLYSS